MAAASLSGADPSGGVRASADELAPRPPFASGAERRGKRVYPGDSGGCGDGSRAARTHLDRLTVDGGSRWASTAAQVVAHERVGACHRRGAHEGPSRLQPGGPLGPTREPSGSFTSGAGILKNPEGMRSWPIQMFQRSDKGS